MRLHLEQDNLNDERQACTAILSNLEGNGIEMRSCKEGRGTRYNGQDLRDIVESIRVRHEGSPSDDEIREKEAKGR